VKPLSPRGFAMASLAFAAVLPATVLSVSAKAQQFQVILHVRHPEGREELVTVSDFRFVYYERRFIRHSTGFGKPADLETRDLPRELRSLQNEDLKKLKFAKIRKVVFEYREQEGQRLLHLVTTRRSRRKLPVDWLAHELRNTSTARAPHFRGNAGAGEVDFQIPPLLELESINQPVLTEIDFQDPLAASHH
jgi:hypothetical protein